MAVRHELPTTLRDILCAQDAMHGRLVRTPLLMSPKLNALAGGIEVYFKAEMFQHTGSFKPRGALNAARLIPKAKLGKGLCTHSSGNCGQAVALAAKQLGVPSYVVMPKNAPEPKKEGVRDLGGSVTECEPTIEARKEACMKVRDETGATQIAHDTPGMCSGHGTLALETFEQVRVQHGTRAGKPLLDAFIAPCGSAGMGSGIAIACKESGASRLVVLAEPILGDDAARSKASGKLEGLNRPATSVADGLRVPMHPAYLPVLTEYVDKVVTVSEDEIVNAMKLIMYHLKVLVEPSAAIGYAALLNPDFPRKDVERVAIVLSGGNVDIDKLPWVVGYDSESSGEKK